MANSKWVCFACRSTYNREHRTCPTCGEAVQFIGQYFKPPKKNNKTEWQAIKILHDAGIRYHHGAVDLQSSLLDSYMANPQPMTNKDLITVIRTASFYYRAYTLKWMAGERPRHPRDAQAYLAKIKARKPMMFDIVQSVADKLGRDHPAVIAALAEIKDL